MVPVLDSESVALSMAACWPVKPKSSRKLAGMNGSTSGTNQPGFKQRVTMKPKRWGWWAALFKR